MTAKQRLRHTGAPATPAGVSRERRATVASSHNSKKPRVPSSYTIANSQAATCQAATIPRNHRAKQKPATSQAVPQSQHRPHSQAPQ
eukprot:gene408-1803_t